MHLKETIRKLIELELHFEQGREKCYSLRIDLERFSAPAPSGEAPDENEKMLQEIIAKRRKQFYKNKARK